MSERMMGVDSPQKEQLSKIILKQKVALLEKALNTLSSYGEVNPIPQNIAESSDTALQGITDLSESKNATGIANIQEAESEIVEITKFLQDYDMSADQMTEELSDRLEKLNEIISSQSAITSGHQQGLEYLESIRPQVEAVKSLAERLMSEDEVVDIYADKLHNEMPEREPVRIETKSILKLDKPRRSIGVNSFLTKILAGDGIEFEELKKASVEDPISNLNSEMQVVVDALDANEFIVVVQASKENLSFLCEPNTKSVNDLLDSIRQLCSSSFPNIELKIMEKGGLLQVVVQYDRLNTVDSDLRDPNTPFFIEFANLLKPFPISLIG